MNYITQTQPQTIIGTWQGDPSTIQTDPAGIKAVLQDLSQSCALLNYQGRLGAVQGGLLVKGENHQQGIPALAEASVIAADAFGDSGFRRGYGIKNAYMAGSMANAISGTELVIALGKAGYLGSYGAGGAPPQRLLEAIQSIQAALPEGPYAFNLIHSPQESLLEQQAVDLYLEHQVRVIEASAYLRLTPQVVQYRAAGLEQAAEGGIQINNRIIAKLSRPEVALQFLSPAPEKVLRGLVEVGKISAQQAALASKVPMADDLTVEADSGGHTDNRPLVGLLPSISALRDQVQRKMQYPEPVRIGAGGGIGTPAAVLGAFSMGAAYVVTGSINQSCQEASTSPAVKQALAQAGAPDVMMAPSADMFEMGVKVQVLKRGTMFPMRSQKLFDVYQSCGSIEAIPPDLRAELEEKIFQRSLDAVWDECVRFFTERDPGQLEKARANPKKKMALIFRWYLGLATHWAIQGLPDRQLDYQIWCGPSMGAFNDWARGTDLEAVENRSVVSVADRLLAEAAYLYRVNQLSMQGFSVPSAWRFLVKS